MSKKTISWQIKDDLKLRIYYNKRKAHLLTLRLKKIRLKGWKKLLKWYATHNHENLLTSSFLGKILTRKRYQKTLKKIFHHPASVTVSVGSFQVESHRPSFLWKGVNINVVYQKTALERVMKPLNTTFFQRKVWVFQQDSASGHTAKTTQDWLSRNVPGFTAAKDWPSSAANLHPLDCKLRFVLEALVCSKALQKHWILLKAATEIPLQIVCAAISQWPERLKAYVMDTIGH